MFDTWFKLTGKMTLALTVCVTEISAYLFPRGSYTKDLIPKVKAITRQGSYLNDWVYTSK